MGDRADELKGNIKKGVGNVTGDTDLETEGQAEHDTAKASREIKGAGKQITGRIQEGLGNVTGDDETRARGATDRLKGDVERAG